MNSVYNQRFRHFGTDFSGLFWRELRIELVPHASRNGNSTPYDHRQSLMIVPGLGVAGSLHVSFVPVVLQKSQKCVATNFP
jgi:hypothetical protein